MFCLQKLKTLRKYPDYLLLKFIVSSLKNILSCISSVHQGLSKQWFWANWNLVSQKCLGRSIHYGYSFVTFLLICQILYSIGIARQRSITLICNSLKEMLVNKQLFSGTIFKQPNECILLNILIVMLKYSGLALKQPLQQASLRGNCTQC